MNNEDLKNLAWHLAKHIENSYRGYEFPCQAELVDYIAGGIRSYETKHINQKVEIIRKDR